MGRPRLGGFLVGLCLGGAVWAAYFIKTNDWAFWTVSVVPVMLFIAVVALVHSLMRNRTFNLALAAGALASVPLVVGAVAAYLLLTIGTLD